MPELITAKEAAARTQVHLKTIYRWLHEGSLKSRRIGKAWLVRVDADGWPIRVRK